MFNLEMFDMFDISSWAKQGLVGSAPTLPKTQKGRLKRKGNWLHCAAVAASIAVIGISSNSLHSVIQPSAVSLTQTDISKDLTPPRYWSKLMSSMAEWKSIEENEVDFDIPEFI